MRSCQKEKITPQVSYQCNNRPLSTKEKTLSGLVDDYQKKYGNCYKDELQWWGDKTLDWKSILERAWISRLRYHKIHPHQRRVSSKLVEGLRISREDRVQPEKFETFDELYKWVESVTHRVKGLGSMTTYDVAQRLGMWLDLSPSVVYLHQGTADGAEKLKIRGKTAPLSAFPLEIQQLGAADAENFLCLYKEHLGELF